jgi:hypothetical protein
MSFLSVIGYTNQKSTKKHTYIQPIFSNLFSELLVVLFHVVVVVVVRNTCDIVMCDMK